MHLHLHLHHCPFLTPTPDPFLNPTPIHAHFASDGPTFSPSPQFIQAAVAELNKEVAGIRKDVDKNTKAIDMLMEGRAGEP